MHFIQKKKLYIEMYVWTEKLFILKPEDMICKYKPEMVITEGNEQNSIKEHLVNLFYTS